MLRNVRNPQLAAVPAAEQALGVIHPVGGQKGAEIGAGQAMESGGQVFLVVAKLLRHIPETDVLLKVLANVADGIPKQILFDGAAGNQCGVAQQPGAQEIQKAAQHQGVRWRCPIQLLQQLWRSCQVNDRIQQPGILHCFQESRDVPVGKYGAAHLRICFVAVFVDLIRQDKDQMIFRHPEFLPIYKNRGCTFFGKSDLAELVDVGCDYPVFVGIAAIFVLIADVFGLILDHFKITTPYFLVIIYHILACVASPLPI